MAQNHLALLENLRTWMPGASALSSSLQGSDSPASADCHVCQRSRHCVSVPGLGVVDPLARTGKNSNRAEIVSGTSVPTSGILASGSKLVDGPLYSMPAEFVSFLAGNQSCYRPEVVGGLNSKSDNGSSSGIEGAQTVQSRLKLTVRCLGIALCFGGIAGLWKAFVSSLPPDFLQRWWRLVNDVPEPDKPLPQETPQETVFYDCNGAVIATISAGGYFGKRDGIKPPSTPKGAEVQAGDIPSWMWQAVVASEDRRFFEHQGVDPRGLARAVLSLASWGGGSTITQQLVKNVFLTSERKWSRKFSELVLAFILETQISKWDILHRYLKRIYWGHGVYGIDKAAALYFGKHPSLLTLGECAMLAGIIPAPEYLSPYHDSSRGRKPQARALRRMVEAGFLDPASAAGALSEPLVLAVESQEGCAGPWKAPYFVSEVLHDLTQRYGWDRIAFGGLQVHTTLDLKMQLIAEKVVQSSTEEYDDERIVLADEGLQRTKTRLESFLVERSEKIRKEAEMALKRLEERSRIRGRPVKVSEILPGSGIAFSEDPNVSTSALVERWAEMTVINRFSRAERYLTTTLAKYEKEIVEAVKSKMEAAMVAIDPLDGAVRVLVGGRDYYESSFNRGTQAYRSPGSTFKPVVYLTALAEGKGRDHVLKDEPFTVGDFTPENFDQKFRGKVTLEESLVYSLNVPTVRLCAEVGVDKVCKMGKVLGIESPLPYELALSLGGCEVTPLQLASVYATIASGGVYHKPHFITRVESYDGRVLEEKSRLGSNEGSVVSQAAVAELRALLQDVVERGTGRAARFGRPCAGKTGTSDDHRDVWFAGFTPEVACVLWMGYDDNAPVGGMHPGTGASHAAPVWKEFMTRVHEGLPLQKFHDPGTDKHGSKAHIPFEKDHAVSRG